MKGRKTLASGKSRRKTFTFFWITALSVAVIGLLYWEQIALLYILATLGVTALLVVVAFADLTGVHNVSSQRESGRVSSPGDGLNSTFGNTPS